MHSANKEMSARSPDVLILPITSVALGLLAPKVLMAAIWQSAVTSERMSQAAHIREFGEPFGSNGA